MITLTVLIAATLLFQEQDRGLTGSETTEHFTIKFRPGSRAAASVDRIAVMAEREYAFIVKALEAKPTGGFELHLYDDLPELVAVTKTRGNGGFSAGNASHLPYDNDQTGVHVHAVASHDARRAVLPQVGAMTSAPDFYAWMENRACWNAYDLAGSFFRYLIDAHGIAKVKAYYTGTPIKEALGVTEEEADAAWRKFLFKYEVRPEVAMLLRRRRGEDVRFAKLELDPDKRLPKEVLGAAGEWKPAAPAGDLPEGWKVNAGALEGESGTMGWNILPIGPARKNAVVRAKIHPVGDCMGVQLQFGNLSQGMLTRAGTFVWKEGVVTQDRSETLVGRQALDLVVMRQGTKLTVWIDGFKILEGEAGEEAAPVGLGVAGGKARFENVRVRDLK
jgi:hypothetical protein